jgi:hypothetical protein
VNRECRVLPAHLALPSTALQIVSRPVSARRFYAFPVTTLRRSSASVCLLDHLEK